MQRRVKAVFYSFPLQLIFHHIKKNLALVAVWALFIATISGGIGRIYGIHYLFLDPEYINTVNFWSFFLVGMAFGNLTMAFHITCYILESHHFSFIGVLERPFAKFSLNNSLIPFLAFVVYIILIVQFQLNNEFSSTANLLLNLCGLVSGLLLMLVLFFSYFKFTNKDIFRYLAGSVDRRLRKTKLSRQRVMSRLNNTRKRKYEVHSYIDLKLRIRSCIGLQDFYNKDAVLKVFDQNHFNSVVIEIAIILVIVFLGTFMENPYLQLPAAASSLLLFSIVVMLVGAVSYWFKGWGLVFTLAIFLIINTLAKVGYIKGTYQARGLNYDIPPVPYDLDQLHQLNNEKHFKEDFNDMLHVLEHWKAKQIDDRPKAVFLCVSGGGQRAALWTLNAMQHADSVLNNQLMNHTVLVTGASGGMIGAAYFRELFLLQKEGKVIPNKKQQLQAMGMDNLNSIIFSLLVNDAFFRVRTVEVAGKKYVKDRGYIFEENLNNNLGKVFSKRLTEYKEPEAEATIPTMLMAPIISNDGRKLYISSNGMSFMNIHESKYLVDYNSKVRGVDFNALFANHGAENLSFLTALRMSASFPYITPTISLPSSPAMEIMDAGIADNFGIGDASRFISLFREWLDANTSGIVIVVIRDTRKSAPIEPQSNPTILDNLTYPIASVYNNLANIQDINNDSRIEEMDHWLNVPINLVEIEYNTYTNIDEQYFISSKEIERKRMERASLSWHLTTKEKKNIIQNIQLRNNQFALKQLDDLLK